MKTISALDLRNNLEGIVKSLKRGERMELTYRGEKVAEMVPSTGKTANHRAVEALHHAWEVTDQMPDYGREAGVYLRQLREDQQKFGERTLS